MSAKPKGQRRLDPQAMPASPRPMMRDEVRGLSWMETVWVRDTQEPEAGLIEARVHGFNPPYCNLLFPSGEGISVAYAKHDWSHAVSDGGQYELVTERAPDHSEEFPAALKDEDDGLAF